MTTNKQYTRVDGKVPLHARVKPQQADPATAIQNRLGSELLKLTAANLTEPTAREAFRKLTLVAARALGACHLKKSGQHWQLANLGTTGRVPSKTDVDETIADYCEEVFNAGTPKLISLECLDDLTGVLAPVIAPGQGAEILLIVTKPDRNSAATLEVVQQIVTGMKLWLERRTAAEATWQVGSLAAILELVGKVETSDCLKTAAEQIVNSTLKRSGANTAAIAFHEREDMRLISVSGIQKLDPSSRTCRDYVQALSESTVRGEQACYPPIDAENDHLLCAHKQTIATLQEQAIVSQPLVSSDGEEIGAWCFTGTQQTILNPQLSRFIATASPHVADAIQLLRRSEKSRFARWMKAIKEKASTKTKIMVPVLIGMFLLAMLMPITYRVRCNATVEPSSRRFAVAPFDGLITTGFVEPGDVVTKGQVLTEIDGRSIRWELAGVTAQRQQSSRQRAIELHDENIPKTFLAELEHTRLSAEENVLKFKKENLQIKSPVDGTILSGSVERAEAASVTTGQVLFEIGTTDSIKVQIAIPAEDISQVKPGNPVTIWVEGEEDAPLESTITRIHPRSEIRDARNVFVAEIAFDNPEQRFRPGMKGSVRIDGERRSLGWSLFHKPMNWARSRLAFW